jgi:Lsr2
MAKKVVTTLIDDLDGGRADETVRFGFEGAEYEIDLSGKNGLKLRKALEPYLSAATKVGRTNGRVAGRGVRAGGSRDENAAIRAWAQENGHDVSERGRIPTAVIAAYRSRG